MFSICNNLDLTVFIDRAFETNGYQRRLDKKENKYVETYRPTRFFEVEEQDTSVSSPLGFDWL